jgi:hypothetical protein
MWWAYYIVIKTYYYFKHSNTTHNTLHIKVVGIKKGLQNGIQKGIQKGFIRGPKGGSKRGSKMARTYLQPHYGNGVFGNVYLSAGQQ